MSEDRNTGISLSNNDYGDDDMKITIDGSKKFINEIALEKNESTIEPGTVFQQLLCKFQEIQTNDMDYQNRFRQVISLYGELIDTITKATAADCADLYKCLKLFQKMIINLVSSAHTQDITIYGREMYFALFDLLFKPEIFMYLNDDQCTQKIRNQFYTFLTNVLLSSLASSITNIPFKNSDVVIRKYSEIICVMYKRVERDMTRSIQGKQEPVRDNQTTDLILSFLWNLSDRTIVVPWLLDTGLVKVMLECLKITKLSSETAEQIINIIHNISRHDDGADELKKFDGLRTIKDIQSNSTEKLDDSNNLLISMAIAQLSTTEEIRSDNKRMNRILNQLLQITMDAAKTENHRSNGLHVSEPLSVLTKLFADDHSLEYVLNHAETDPQLSISSTIALFVDLLIQFQGAFAIENQLKQFTCAALLNILWSISFQNRYKTKLKQNNDLLDTLESMAVDDEEKIIDQYVPRSMESVVNAANGILHNLNELSDSNTAVIANTHVVSNPNNEKPIIMISYSHDNNQFCDKILAEFEKNRNLFGIWIDRDHCSSSEDLWEKIARGIGQSKIVMCLLSQEYFNSKSCRKEMTFAIKRKKAIIPIYMDDPGDCDWLDIHIAGLKYVRFKNNTTTLDHNKIQEMLKTIHATIDETQSQPLERHSIPTQPRKDIEIIPSIALDEKKAPEQCTDIDIQKWFSSHHVPDTLTKLYDFQSVAEINQYASKLHADSKHEFEKYRQRYAKNNAGEELEEYIFDRFKNALFKLLNNQTETTKLSMPSPETSTSKSSICTIS